jgi:hypothetical protein
MLYDEHQHGFLKKLSNQIIGHIGDLQDATGPKGHVDSRNVRTME